MASPSAVTQLLHEARAGDTSAMDRLFPLVYDELRRLADSRLRHERSGHTLQRTALVHEAYLRMIGDTNPDFQDRSHFLGIAARIMRQILVDYARRRNAGKRSAGLKEPLEEASGAFVEHPADMIQLHNALSDLEKHDAQKAQLIEMRFFGGLTAEESASALGLTVAVVRRELRLAQAWLERALDVPRSSD